MKEVAIVFWKFLMLGCVSFGGPAAHVGYFHQAFVERLKWLDEDSYANLLSLSQVLPGPGSSQLGFAIGLQRAGLLGGIAAFIGFTLPSFFILYLVAVFSLQASGDSLFAGVIHGLKLLAVVVVADACISMYKKFCSNKLAASIAAVTAITLLVVPSFLTQIAVLLLAAVIGLQWGEKKAQAASAQQGISWLPLGIFIALISLLPFVTQQSPLIKLFNDFYQSGSLVFGGGHVVLPLLQQLLGDSISTDRFLLGYASAQAIPGPMFSLASFLGAELFQQQPLLGAAIATLAIFLPGFLLVLALKNAWQSLLAKPAVQGGVWGINAAVVGLLISALYQPVFISAVVDVKTVALVIAGLLGLLVYRLPILFLVLAFAAAGALLNVQF